MLTKRLLALTLFAALAVMPPCGLRAQWVQVNGKGGASVTSLAVSGTNIFAGTNSGIVLSTDNGVRWSAADSGLNNKNITNLYASGSNVFAATYVGGGGSMVVFIAGIPIVPCGNWLLMCPGLNCMLLRP